MELKFLKLRDLQGKTPTFPVENEIHIIYVPEENSSNLHKAGAGRTMIREILAYYLGVSKNLIRLRETIHGKPYLVFPPIKETLYFNISHTEDYLVFALSTSAPLGIDIEKAERNVRLRSLMSRFFHDKEIIKFLNYTEEERNKRFIRYWTLKESFVKGLGTGLQTSFTSFYLAKESKHTYLAIPDDKKLQEEYSSWRIKPIPAPEGFVCSISYRPS